ncbi:MAG: hypothetical protein JHD16_18715 [Solirubrobacteraceae bacterium]|nr:hypothetical protein [Solirubrobacteraceae bacterium]
MSTQMSFGRRAITAACGVLLTLGVTAPATFGATTVDQGDPTNAAICSDALELETTCLIPFGPPVASDGAITSISVGDDRPLLLIARPVVGSPGTFRATRVSTNPLTWRVRPGTTSIDTAIRVRAGDQLVLVDPLIKAEGSTVDFETSTPETLTSLTTGQPVGLTAVGRITFEPDADADGYGDETGDLCPGVEGRTCSAAAMTVVLAGPAYVPSQSPLVWNWGVANIGDAPQPLVVNLFSGEATPTVTGPPGSTCLPGAVTSADQAFVPSRVRSPLAVPPLSSSVSGPMLLFPDARKPASGWFHCRTPVLAPGASTGGTLGGSGGMVGAGGLTAVAMAANTDALTRQRSTLAATASVDHRAPGSSPMAWKPTVAAAAPISVTGRFLVDVSCGGPVAAASCTISGVVKAPVGGTVLGKLAAPISTKPGGTSRVTLVFSKKGLRWLAGRRKSSVDLVITTSWPGETPLTRNVRLKPKRSPALERKLKRLLRDGKRKR